MRGIRTRRKVCYYTIVAGDDGVQRVRFGFDRRVNCQIEVGPERWEELAARLKRAGIELVEWGDSGECPTPGAMQSPSPTHAHSRNTRAADCPAPAARSRSAGPSAARPTKSRSSRCTRSRHPCPERPRNSAYPLSRSTVPHAGSPHSGHRGSLNRMLHLRMIQRRRESTYATCASAGSGSG